MIKAGARACRRAGADVGSHYRSLLAQARMGAQTPRAIIFSVLAASLACGCWPTSDTGNPLPATRPTLSNAYPTIPHPSLTNAHRVTPKVLSGAEPEGDAGFAALRDLGVKTVLSVDGAKPDVDLAHEHGLRYVHLPIGYGGV